MYVSMYVSQSVIDLHSELSWLKFGCLISSPHVCLFFFILEDFGFGLDLRGTIKRKTRSFVLEEGHGACFHHQSVAVQGAHSGPCVLH